MAIMIVTILNITASMILLSVTQEHKRFMIIIHYGVGPGSLQNLKNSEIFFCDP